MTIDITTLIVCNVVLSFMFVICFSVYLFGWKTSPGFRLWTAGLLVHAIGLLLVLLSGGTSSGMAMIAANTLFTLSVVLAVDALTEFLQDTRLQRFYYLIPLGVAVFCSYYTFVHDDIAMRTAGVSLTVSFLMLAAAAMLIRQAFYSSRLLKLFGAIILIAYSGAILFRAYRCFFSAGHHVFGNHPGEYIYFVIALLAGVGMNCFYLLITSQRSEQMLLFANTALADSEMRYRRLSDASFEGVVFTKDGEIVEMNDKACSIFGYGQGELVGISAVDLVADKDRDTVIQKIADCADDAYEVTGRRRDGTSFALEIQGRTFTYRGEETRVAALRDITERKRADEVRHERDRLYKTLFELNRSVMLLIDQETACIVDANKAACAYYGYDREQLILMKITDLNTLSEEEVFAEMKRAAEEQRNYFNFSHRRADGTIGDVEVFSGPVTYWNRPLLCSVIHDITQRKLDEAEREKLIESLQKALQEIKTLQGILPICSYCKKIRDDEGSWSQIEHYVRKHSEATFSHGICPQCVREQYPEIADEALGIANSKTHNE